MNDTGKSKHNFPGQTVSYLTASVYRITTYLTIVFDLKKEEKKDDGNYYLKIYTKFSSASLISEI